MRAGSLRHTLSFERRVDARNAYNELVGTWQLIATERGAIEPLTGDERSSAMQMQSEETARIRCRYTPALAKVGTRDRVRAGDAIYDIRAVIDINMQHRELHFMVKQHGAG